MAVQADSMEQSVPCDAEDTQPLSGDEDACGMSVISVDSTSPTSVDSVDSSTDDVDGSVADDYPAADGVQVEASPANGHHPVLDAEQCSDLAGNESSENSNVSVTSTKDVADDIDQCDSLLHNLQDNVGENSVSDNSAESSDKSDVTVEDSPEIATASEPGISPELFEINTSFKIRKALDRRRPSAEGMSLTMALNPVPS